MRRAGKRSIGILCAAAALAAPVPALAFHAGQVFDRPPGAGGGGGIFYTGARLDHGWDCTVCHQNAEGRIKVQLEVEPSDLFGSFRYEPGKTYSFTATMKGEHLGLQSPRSNYNGIAVSFVDSRGFPAGTIGGFAADEFYQGTTAIASITKPGVTSWKLAWTAPAAGAGKVLLHLGAVDGNGADSPPSETLTDPFGDDIFVATVTFEEGPAKHGERAPGPLPCALGAALIGLAQRRRTLTGPRRTDNREAGSPLP